VLNSTEHPLSAADPIVVAVATESDSVDWEAYVASREDASGYHGWAWRRVFQQSFGHECVYLIARLGSQTTGVLPLVHISSRLFGRHLTSLPFLNYGGVVADSVDVGKGLVNEAVAIARTRGCRHVELRHIARRFDDLPCKQHKVTMRLELSPGLWERLDRKVRNQIRKAEKSQLQVVRGKDELLSEFYQVFARNMRDLGTPVYARRFFAEILNAFPEHAHVVVVRLGDRPVAAGLTYRTGDVIEIPWASSVRDYNSLCPNHLLYWHALQAAIAEGCTTFDFGRSTPNEGTYKFKEQWGARPVTLHWEYRLLQGNQLPDQSPKNPKFRIAIELWKRLPLWLTNIIGPSIVRSIP
jgi:FemAB-related protein (PEP-CTERM system-associated)